MVKEEAQTRIERLPFALLGLAARKLPEDVREAILQEEWLPELHFIIRETEGLPLTRLGRGIRFTLGLLSVSSEVGTELEVTRLPQPPSRNTAITTLIASNMLSTGIDLDNYVAYIIVDGEPELRSRSEVTETQLSEFMKWYQANQGISRNTARPDLVLNQDGKYTFMQFKMGPTRKG